MKLLFWAWRSPFTQQGQRLLISHSSVIEVITGVVAAMIISNKGE